MQPTDHEGQKHELKTKGNGRNDTRFRWCPFLICFFAPDHSETFFCSGACGNPHIFYKVFLQRSVRKGRPEDSRVVVVFFMSPSGVGMCFSLATTMPRSQARLRTTLSRTASYRHHGSFSTCWCRRVVPPAPENISSLGHFSHVCPLIIHPICVKFYIPRCHTFTRNLSRNACRARAQRIATQLYFLLSGVTLHSVVGVEPVSPENGGHPRAILNIVVEGESARLENSIHGGCRQVPTSTVDPTLVFSMFTSRPKWAPPRPGWRRSLRLCPSCRQHR